MSFCPIWHWERIIL